MAATVLSATARHIETVRLAGMVHVFDANTGNRIGLVDVIRGFAFYVGDKGSAHEGFRCVIGGGVEGLTAALAQGVRNGRDDRR